MRDHRPKADKGRKNGVQCRDDARTTRFIPCKASASASTYNTRCASQATEKASPTCGVANDLAVSISRNQPVCFDSGPTNSIPGPAGGSWRNTKRSGHSEGLNHALDVDLTAFCAGPHDVVYLGHYVFSVRCKRARPPPLLRQRLEETSHRERAVGTQGKLNVRPAIPAAVPPVRGEE